MISATKIYSGLTRPLTWSIVRSLHKCQNVTSQEGTRVQTMNNDKLSEYDQVNPNFINRNPRNLEKMGVARKDAGWQKSYPRRYYWHRLVIKQSLRNTEIWVEHYNGHKVVSASTTEWAIKKHLHSSTDVVAVRNLGRVLAQRCLESGITNMIHQIHEEELESEKNKVLLEALMNGGIVFSETDPDRCFKEEIDFFPENA